MSEDKVNLEINGVAVSAQPGTMLIEAAESAGIHIPRFCYHKKLSVAANCRMCMVEIEKAPKTMPACATQVGEGMKVFTNSPKAVAAQKGTMEFLLINHPLDCPICDQGGECELQDVAVEHGEDVSRFIEDKRVVEDPDLGPLVATDMTRCIHCTRCVRFGEEIAGLREMGATGRGEDMKIGTFIEKSIDSELSGNIIDLCPVGALTSKPSRYYGRPWEVMQHAGIAAHDAVGSNTAVHTRNGKVIRVVPRDNETINECWLSDRDRFSYQGIYAADRVTEPMIKRNGKWVETDWETALEHVNGNLQGFASDQVAGLLSPVATLEELYLAQKYLRGLGVNAIEHRLRQIDFSDQNQLPLFPWLGGSVEALEQQQAVLLVGSNIRKDQPIAAHRLRKAALAGASISSINAKDYGFRFDLSENIVTDPQGMVDQLAGVAASVLEKKGVSAPDSIAELLKSAAKTDATKAIADQLMSADRALVLLGALAGLHPAASALRALATVISEYSGASLGYMPEAANSAGAWLAGALPHRGPAGQALEDSSASEPVLSRSYKAYFLMGVEPEFDTHNPAQTLAAVSEADYVVVMSPYASEQTKQYANVILPVTSAAEMKGTYVNAEGRWQSFNAAIHPLGNARPGWRVFRVLGNMASLDGFEQLNSTDVRDELKGLFDSAPDFSNAMSLNGHYEHPKNSQGLQRISGLAVYGGDSLVRRAQALQQTADARFDVAMMSAEEAKKHGLDASAPVKVTQQDASSEMPLVIDHSIPAGCVYINMGTEASARLGSSFGEIEITGVSESS